MNILSILSLIICCKMLIRGLAIVMEKQTHYPRPGAHNPPLWVRVFLLGCIKVNGLPKGYGDNKNMGNSTTTITKPL